jgi:hypothetical protein
MNVKTSRGHQAAERETFAVKGGPSTLLALDGELIPAGQAYFAGGETNVGARPVAGVEDKAVWPSTPVQKQPRRLTPELRQGVERCHRLLLDIDALRKRLESMPHGPTPASHPVVRGALAILAQHIGASMATKTKEMQIRRLEESITELDTLLQESYPEPRDLTETIDEGRKNEVAVRQVMYRAAADKEPTEALADLLERWRALMSQGLFLLSAAQARIPYTR